VVFLSIYIREAHPVDGWWLGKGISGRLVKLFEPKVSTDLYDPITMEERRVAAGVCQETLKYGIHTYVDTMDDAANKSYAAWPTRLYLIGIHGQVVYKGGLGPFGFHPKKLGEEIETYFNQM
jgi:hypothetical protein